MLQISAIPAFTDNYIWLLAHCDNQKAVVVDPGLASPILQYLEQQGLALSAILITHHHRDHCGGIAELVTKYPVPVYGPAHEMIAGVTHKVSESSQISIPELELNFQVLDIPGHTQGHIAYYGQGRLFCGDTLFGAGCGRLFEGTATQLYQSLCRLSALPDDTLIYCGHEYTLANLAFAATIEPSNPWIKQRLSAAQQQLKLGLPTLPSTLAIERQTNPFLRCMTPSVRQTVTQKIAQQPQQASEIFRLLRAWKDQFVTPAAFSYAHATQINS